jgi:hypothetical protein
MGMTIVRERNPLQLSGVSFYFTVHEASEQERRLRRNELEERDMECHRRGKLSATHKNERCICLDTALQRIKELENPWKMTFSDKHLTLPESIAFNLSMVSLDQCPDL